MIPVSPASAAANASAHVVSRSSPSSPRSKGRRRRSGSCTTLSNAEPFGQMKPWLNTWSRSPRTRVMRSPSIASSRPHVASHSGQVRKATLVSVTATSSRHGLFLSPWNRLCPPDGDKNGGGSLHDQGGDHAEHPGVPLGVGEDVAVPGPGAGLVGVDQDGVALTGPDEDGVGLVG